MARLPTLETGNDLFLFVLSLKTSVLDFALIKFSELFHDDFKFDLEGNEEISKALNKTYKSRKTHVFSVLLLALNERKPIEHDKKFAPYLPSVFPESLIKIVRNPDQKKIKKAIPQITTQNELTSNRLRLFDHYLSLYNEEEKKCKTY